MILPRIVTTLEDVNRELVRHALAFNDEERWKLIPHQAYTYTAPASTSSLTVKDTSWATAGLPVKWMQNGTAYYGIIKLVTSNTSITIDGAPLIASTPIQMLWVGRPEQVVTYEFYGAGAYGDLGIWYTKFKPARHYWSRATGYMVQLLCIHETNATTSQPQINVTISDGAGTTLYILTANGGNGIAVTNGWASSGVGIDASKYRIVFGRRVSLQVMVADTGATRAQDFSGRVTFVLE